MEEQFLERVIEESGNDLDSVIKTLNKLSLISEENLGSAPSINDAQDTNTKLSNQDSAVNNGATTPAQDPQTVKIFSIESAEWVDLFVREMMGASNIDDAKARASRSLEILKKSIHGRGSTAEAAQNFQQEILILKQQIQSLIYKNNILKRAVTIQHDRQKEFDRLKQLVAQYQEQLRTLEVNNYALSMHLKQSQKNDSVPRFFHPDVF